MKQISLFIIISFLFATYSFNLKEPKDITQMVAIVPELESQFLKEKLEFEFISVKGVIDCDVSLETKTILMKYDAKKVSFDKITSIFYKWGCVPGEYSYQKIF